MIDFILITRKLKKKINNSTLMKILKDTKIKLLNLAIIVSIFFNLNSHI